MLLNANIEWHLKGTCIWIPSIIGILLNIFVVVLNLRQIKHFSTINLLAIMIAISAIFILLGEQATFIQECIPAIYAPLWFFPLRRFTLSDVWTYFQNFFPWMIDLLIGFDCLIRFIVICTPQRKEVLLSKKAVTACLVFLLGLGSLFSALALKMKQELDSVYIGSGILDYAFIYPQKYTWIYTAVLQVMAR